MTPILRPHDQRPFTGQAGDAEIVLQVSNQGRRKIRICAFATKYASGAAAAVPVRPRIYTSSGEAADGLNEKWRLSAATAAYNTLVNQTLDRVCYTDADGKVYVKLDGDATNLYDGELWYEVLV